MNILAATPNTLRYAGPKSSSLTLADEKKTDAPKPSAVDAFSSGANKGGNVANTLIGAWNGAVGGAVTGGAVALGANVISAGWGAISGSNPLSWGTLLSTVTSTGLWAAGGAVAGGVIGGVVMNKVGDAVGNVGALVAKKAGGNENVGRAIGTVGTGVLAGAAFGASVAGVNGALIAGGAGLVFGGMAWLKN